MSRWMRSLVLVLPLILVLAAAACEEESNPAQGSASGARIAFETESVDFGQVPLDKEVRHIFKFKNVGSDTLTLRDVRVRLVEGC